MNKYYTWWIIGSVLIICVYFTIIFNWDFSSEEEKRPIDRYYVLDSKLELEMWSAKAELVDSVQSYIYKYAPTSDLSALVLLNGCIEYDVDLLLAICQARKESHFGTRGLAARTNNVFNVGAYDGLSYDKINKVYKKNHPNLSVEQYLITMNTRYLVGKTTADLLTNFVDVNGKRYASYEKYEEELTIMYRALKSSKIGELYEKFLLSQLKLNY